MIICAKDPRDPLSACIFPLDFYWIDFATYLADSAHFFSFFVRTGSLVGL